MELDNFTIKHLEEPSQTRTVLKKIWSQPRCSVLKISDTYGAKDPGGFDNESGQAPGSLKGSAS